jgi:hypothetical protein
MVDSCPNYLDAPSHKSLAYLPKFGLLTQFGRTSTGDRPNFESSEFRGTCEVAPKNERQIATLDKKLSSSEPRASIAREQCRFQHASQLDTWYEWV